MRTVVSFLLLGLSAVYGADQIQVKVLSAKDGHPVPGKPVALQLPRTQLEASTDANGVATFALPTPRPTMISVATKEECWQDWYDTTAILHDGIVEKNDCFHKSKQLDVKAQPGQLVIFTGDYKRWERWVSKGYTEPTEKR